VEVDLEDSGVAEFGCDSSSFSAEAFSIDKEDNMI